MDAQQGFKLFSYFDLWNYHKFMNVSNFTFDSARWSLPSTINNYMKKKRRKAAHSSAFAQYFYPHSPRSADVGQKAQLCKAAECCGCHSDGRSRMYIRLILNGINAITSTNTRTITRTITSTNSAPRILSKSLSPSSSEYLARYPQQGNSGRIALIENLKHQQRANPPPPAAINNNP